MIKIFLLLCLIPFHAWSKVSLELVLNSSSVKQGEMARGRLVVKQAEGQTGLAGLKGQNLGKTLYLLSLSPFMGKQGQFEAEAKVIFVAVPQVNEVSEVINGEEIFISWNNIEVVPTEPAKSFLLGDFEIPERKKIIKWILILLGLFLFMGLSYWLKRHLDKKKISKNQIKRLRDELMGCQSYDDIVNLWRQKRQYLNAFPIIESNFKFLEDVLFKYQFKAQRTEKEIEEVLVSYQKFKTEISGVLNGI